MPITSRSEVLELASDLSHRILAMQSASPFSIDGILSRNAECSTDQYQRHMQQEMDENSDKSQGQIQPEEEQSNMTQQPQQLFSGYKKSRTAYTSHQIIHLELAFATKKYLSNYDRYVLARSLNLSETQVRVWFQNRRNKLKRHESALRAASLASNSVNWTNLILQNTQLEATQGNHQSCHCCCCREVGSR